MSNPNNCYVWQIAWPSVKNLEAVLKLMDAATWKEHLEGADRDLKRQRVLLGVGGIQPSIGSGLSAATCSEKPDQNFGPLDSNCLFKVETIIVVF